jgi:hypothetical protein
MYISEDVWEPHAKTNKEKDVDYVIHNNNYTMQCSPLRPSS